MREPRRRYAQNVTASEASALATPQENSGSWISKIGKTLTGGA